MSKALRKNDREVRELFKKNLKCVLVDSLNEYKPRETDKELVEFDLTLKNSRIVRVVEGEKYCVYSIRYRYNITVIE